MIYAKNVPNWERALRAVMGLMSLGYAAYGWGTSGIAVGIGVTGAIFALTGLVGFCPMCAMVGRKPDRKQ